jgi:hypothetical protein
MEASEQAYSIVGPVSGAIGMGRCPVSEEGLAMLRSGQRD